MRLIVAVFQLGVVVTGKEMLIYLLKCGLLSAEMASLGNMI